MKKFVREIFTDSRGSFSSKRTITIAAFILLTIAFIANLFFGFTMEQFIFDSMAYIVLGGLGFATAEPLANAFFNRSKNDMMLTSANLQPGPEYHHADVEPRY